MICDSSAWWSVNFGIGLMAEIWIVYFDFLFCCMHCSFLWAVGQRGDQTKVVGQSYSYKKWSRRGETVWATLARVTLCLGEAVFPNVARGVKKYLTQAFIFKNSSTGCFDASAILNFERRTALVSSRNIVRPLSASPDEIKLKTKK